MQGTYETISTISFALSLLFFILSLFFFLKFDIWKVIGDLSGRTAKKSIERIKASGEAASVKKKDSLPLFFSKGRISEAIGNLAGDKKYHGISRGFGVNKDTVYTGGTNITEDLPDENSTEILQEASGGDGIATEILTPEKEVDRTPVEIKLLEEIIIIHTKDVIE
ncbi:hypothetical protein [Clostridium polynesiense]|uniref:hypothetical protein n=1 Tax=Clostridium polynesiense TaxID=1325933 RepID=UPI00058F08C9|nr:hypothetical protein [Clostridium polynesiense]